ncbi:MAG: hypothetical protein ACK56F_16195, partial [bacterium]
FFALLMHGLVVPLVQRRHLLFVDFARTQQQHRRDLTVVSDVGNRKNFAKKFVVRLLKLFVKSR